MMGKLDRTRALKLRFRRRFRLRKRQVEELGVQAEQRLESDFFRRVERLGSVKRFVTSWMLLVILLVGCVISQGQSLSKYYQVLTPAPGGTFTEGVLGSFTNANPVYATDLVDTSVSKLLFSGLFTYDKNNKLVGDLAESWAVDPAGTTYTVVLKKNLKWHDGRALTASDVLFTYQVIQNPDAKSPLFSSWNGVIVSAPDVRTVTFKLPSALASFPYSLTNGIIPKHILGTATMADMRSLSFNNTAPVGSGPFQWQAIELSGSGEQRQETIALKPFETYHLGQPKLNGFVVRTFRSAESLIGSFKSQKVMAMAGLTSVPDTLKHEDIRVYNLPLTASVMAFFRTQEGILADVKIRQALVAATNTQSIINGLDYPTVPVRQALMRGQLAYDAKYNQAGFDPVAAAKILTDDGWAVGQGGVRFKGTQPLRFNLTFLNSSDYSSVAHQLAQQWRKVGADVVLVAQDGSDFRSVLASAPSLGNGTYDVLLYGISIGVDPDVFVYWHSSQIDLRSPSRLNFSMYKSGVANEGLVGGRTRLDPALRTAKYTPFLQAWQADAPALGLYQPRLLYISHAAVNGLEESPVNSDAGRFHNVQNWQIRQEWVTP